MFGKGMVKSNFKDLQGFAARHLQVGVRMPGGAKMGLGKKGEKLQTIEYMQALESLFEASGKGGAQRAWYAWQLEKMRQAGPAAVTPIQDLPAEARASLDRALESWAPVQKECHANAWRLCAQGFGMASGMALAMIPMEHSWSFWTDAGGKVWHFDATAELALGQGLFEEYVPVCLHAAGEALELGVRTGHSGHWLREMFERDHPEFFPDRRKKRGPGA